MASKLSTKVIDVQTLSEAEFESLVDTVSAVASSVFDGASRKELAKYFSGGGLTRAWVQLFSNQAGECVGFNNVALYERKTEDGAVSIFRSLAAILREHRGGSSTVLYPLFKAMAYKAGHPFTRVYYFGHLLHPSSYYLFYRLAAELWPRPGRETPAPIHAFMMQLADERGYPPPDDPDRPYTRASSVKTRESDEDQSFWLTSDKPPIRFYVDQNPEFSAGCGLITLIPLTWSNLMVAAGRFAWRTLRRTVRR
jgi:hypothetical protein